MFIRVLLSVEFCFTLKTYLKRAPFYNASAEGKVGHAVGKDMEALHSRKAEKQIGRAGNDDRRPERYPARGIKGKASEQRDLRDDRRQKKNQYCLALRRQVGVKPRGASRKGPNRLLATHYAESLATSHLAQPAEPPYADPHVRWCGRGGRATVPPIPIVPSMLDSLEVKVLYPV